MTVALRDMALIALPIAGFVREMARGQPSVEIMLGCMAALSAPGLLAAGWAVRQPPGPTGSPSDSSPPHSHSQPP